MSTLKGCVMSLRGNGSKVQNESVYIFAIWVQQFVFYRLFSKVQCCQFNK